MRVSAWVMNRIRHLHPARRKEADDLQHETGDATRSRRCNAQHPMQPATRDTNAASSAQHAHMQCATPHVPPNNAWRGEQRMWFCVHAACRISQLCWSQCRCGRGGPSRGAGCGKGCLPHPARQSQCRRRCSGSSRALPQAARTAERMRCRRQLQALGCVVLQLLAFAFLARARRR